MNPLIIGIAGGTGSGKTTVTNRIVDALEKSRVLVIQHDSYYRDLSSHGDVGPAAVNFDHPASLETSLLIEHLKALKSGKPVQQPLYNFTTHRRLPSTKLIEPRDIIIVEGILIFVDKELRDLITIKIFIDADADERLLRRLKRDTMERGRSIDSVMDQYITTVKPMHLEFVEPSKHWADVIIPRGAENTVAIDMVATKIRQMVQQ